VRILLIALLAVAALPAAADAATVSRTGGTLRYEAGKGERISGSVIETRGGAFLARSDTRAHQRLVPGAGCKRGRPHALRCAGQGVARVEISLKRGRTSRFMVQDVRVAVAAVGSAGMNSTQFRRTPEFTYDGGAKRDDVAVRDSPGGHSTIRLGAGADFFDGQPPALGAPDSTATSTVEGGPGRDYPISVTLDGQRNDGTAGQDALVGADIENAGISPTSSPTDAVLVGNDGPTSWWGPARSAASAGTTPSSATISKAPARRSTAGTAMTGSRLARGTPPAPASPKRRRASPAGPAPTSSSRTLRRPPTASA
jgi:hypothetical protein